TRLTPPTTLARDLALERAHQSARLGGRPLGQGRRRQIQIDAVRVFSRAIKDLRAPERRPLASRVAAAPARRVPRPGRPPARGGAGRPPAERGVTFSSPAPDMPPSCTTPGRPHAASLWSSFGRHGTPPPRRCRPRLAGPRGP